jgi:hypothetical protein
VAGLDVDEDFSVTLRSPKKTVLNAIIRACFTFAAMQSVSGDVILLAIRLPILREKLKIPLAIPTLKILAEGAVSGLISSGHLLTISLIYPERKDMMIHWIIARGARWPSKSTGRS